MSYAKTVFVDNIVQDDYSAVHKAMPLAKVINVSFTEEQVASHKAVDMVNASLPARECVIRVESVVSDGSGGFHVHMRIMD